jgi:hypothetical protein
VPRDGDLLLADREPERASAVNHAQEDARKNPGLLLSGGDERRTGMVGRAAPGGTVLACYVRRNKAKRSLAGIKLMATR